MLIWQDNTHNQNPRRSKAVDEEVRIRVSRYQLLYSMSGLVGGIVAMVLGSALFLYGVTSPPTHWWASLIGAKSSISDAAPGAVLFVVRLFLVWITRFEVRVRQN
jgi:hypothetical protein